MCPRSVRSRRPDSRQRRSAVGYREAGDSTPSRLPSALAATALLGAALVLAGASSASAHDALESSTPAAGEVVTVDSTVVTLTYSDELLTLGGDTSAFAIQVTDASGAFHENGCVVVDGLVASTGVALGDPERTPRRGRWSRATGIRPRAAIPSSTSRSTPRIPCPGCRRRPYAETSGRARRARIRPLSPRRSPR